MRQGDCVLPCSQHPFLSVRLPSGPDWCAPAPFPAAARPSGVPRRHTHHKRRPAAPRSVLPSRHPRTQRCALTSSHARNVSCCTRTRRPQPSSPRRARGGGAGHRLSGKLQRHAGRARRCPDDNDRRHRPLLLYLRRRLHRAGGKLPACGDCCVSCARLPAGCQRASVTLHLPARRQKRGPAPPLPFFVRTPSCVEAHLCACPCCLLMPAGHGDAPGCRPASGLL